jgi:lysozyme family protein
MMNFGQSFEALIGHEGGFVDHPADPGGETNFGISKRAYPNEDIVGMTLERAKQIYHRDYWSAAGCESVPDALKFQLFDMAVNSGAQASIKTLQLAACTQADGVIGSQTLMAVQSMPAARLVARFNGHRLQLMVRLPTWPTFGRGWAGRIAANLLEA